MEIEKNFGIDNGIHPDFGGEEDKDEQKKEERPRVPFGRDKGLQIVPVSSTNEKKEKIPFGKDDPRHPDNVN